MNLMDPITKNKMKRNFFWLSLVFVVLFVACGFLTYKFNGIFGSQLADIGDCTFETRNGTNYLKKYNGRYTDIILPKDYNGETYEIDNEAFSGSSISSIVIPEGVTRIGENAFANCERLTSITIPDSVTYIGDNAFRYCSSLTSITIPNSVTSIGDSAFSSCSSLTSITIPNSVTSIGDSAFSSCSNLMSITIPDSVTNIGNYAFYNCYKLTSVTIPNSVTSIGDSTFSSCSNLMSITIPDSVTRIGVSAFEGCSSLKEITLPFVGSTKNGTSNTHFGYIFGASSDFHNSSYVPTSLKKVTITSAASIGDSAFRYCSSLTSITIPNSVTSIGDSAFSSCSSLTSVTIPNSVTSIGDSAFSSCSNLMSITIPDSVTRIGVSAFKGCSALTSITIPNSVTSIGDSTFSSCSNLMSITIPDSVTNIGVSAFEGCSSLKEITLPFVGSTKNGTSNTHFGYIFGASSDFYNSSYVPTSLKKVTITSAASIGDSAFSSCSSLTSITIPNSVTSIGDSAFSSCSSLTSITIPNSVTSIGDSAFGGCSSLTYNEYDNAYYLGNSNNKYLLLIKAKSKDITSCTINSNCKFIHSSAFYGCRNLAGITIPDRVTSIGDSAFYGCSGLAEITLPFMGSTKNGTSYTHFGYIFGASSYSYNSRYVPASLKNVTITSVTSIGNYVFYSCGNITSVTIPESVTSIGNYAFNGCSSLTSVTIPDSVTNIGSDAFYGCYKLVEVYNLSNFTITNGSTSNGYIGYYAKVIHTSKDEKSILKTVNDFTFITADGVNYLVEYNNTDTDITLSTDYNGENYEIYRYAFYGCSSLTSVTIPDSVTNIGNYAFYNCYKLTSVTIGNSVTSIGSFAFYNCSGLTTINYTGTSTQWRNISKGNDWNHNVGNYTIYYL